MNKATSIVATIIYSATAAAIRNQPNLAILAKRAARVGETTNIIP